MVYLYRYYKAGYLFGFILVLILVSATYAIKPEYLVDVDPGETIEINGEKGSIFWNFEDQNYLLYYDNTQSPKEAGFKKINATHDVHPYGGGWWPQGHGIGYADLFVIEVTEFIRSIIEETPFNPNFEDGVKCQEVLEAVEQSANKRIWIEI